MVKEFEHLTANPLPVHTFKILQKKHSSVFTPGFVNPWGLPVYFPEAKLKEWFQTLGFELQPPNQAI